MDAACKAHRDVEGAIASIAVSPLVVRSPRSWLLRPGRTSPARLSYWSRRARHSWGEVLSSFRTCQGRLFYRRRRARYSRRRPLSLRLELKYSQHMSGERLPSVSAINGRLTLSGTTGPFD